MQLSYLHRFTLDRQVSSFQCSNQERISEKKADSPVKNLNSQENDESAWEEEAVGFGPLWGFYDMWI